MANLTSDLAHSLISSSDEYPVDFDDAWKWIGYSTKQKALQTLKSNFGEGLDFLTKGLKTSSCGRPSQHIVLTIDCFKSLAMMAGTGKGKEVRLYFLNCEKELKNKKSNTPVVKAPLSSVEKADKVHQLKESIEFFGLDVSNPRFNQELKDMAGDILGLASNANSLPGTAKWYGVAERAEELGYPVSKVTKYRSALGRHVSKNNQGQYRMEKRLCNGTAREIKVYESCSDLDNAIHSYMATK